MTAALRGQTAVNHYQRERGGEPDLPTSLADLVADLILWSAHHDLDWDRALDRAEWYAQAEACCADHGGGPASTR
ncbi:hypothetical protein [Streptomyces sp. NPDC001889]